MSAMLSIAYISTARQRMNEVEIAELLRVSQRNNAKTGITGVLLYCNGSFMQFFEGPKETALDLYQRVKADDRHHGIIELFRAAVDRREFGEWSMGYAQAMAPTMQALGIADWRPPATGQASPGHLVLSNFWSNNCGAPR